MLAVVKSVDNYDYLVVGGGIVGISTAWQLKRRSPTARVLLLDKEPRVASHQSGHNSGVVHAGIYYPPGSLKAQFCQRGAAATIDFCRQHKIAYQRCGKLLVATFALFFIESFVLENKDLIIVPLMCILCVAIPFVLVTIAPRFIPAAEVNLFFLLETIIGPIWVWLIIKEQPSIETLQGGIVIILTIAIHSFLKLKNS